MTKRSEIDGTTDLEALEVFTVKNPTALAKCSKSFRQGARRSHVSERYCLSAAKPTLPKLKFLEGKDP